MSSGSHLSKELLDLVKSIGESRSKQEEDKIITAEAQILKSKFLERNLSEKKLRELLIRAIYVEMLGHDASFSHIHAVNLTQSKSLIVKRIGYLACSLFIDENSELLILLICTIQRDLQSKNHLEVLAALSVLTKLANQHILMAVHEAVQKLLSHNHEMIRKKAVIVIIKFHKIYPSAIDQMDMKMKKALCDKDPSVMAASLNYFSDQVKQRPADYKDLVNSFVVILKQVIEHRLPRDYDYHRLPAPWIQMKILEILAYLGADDKTTSEQMFEVLSSVMKRGDDAGINIGYALVYQCLRCITMIYPQQSLIDTATNMISRFLSSESHNLKYIGITGLAYIVKIDPKYTLNYQAMVVDCLEDADDTLKIKTLDLLYRMTNKQNVEAIVEKLLSYLKEAPIESSVRKDLVIKINSLGEQYSPSKNWYVRTMNKLYEMGGDLITADLSNKFIQSISDYEKEVDGEKFREQTVKIYLRILKKNPNIPDAMMQVIAWIMGEYAAKMQNSKKLVNILDHLSDAAYRTFEDELTRGYILSAITKLHASLAFQENIKVESVMKDYITSKHIDVQQRAIEYKALKENHQKLPQGATDIILNTPLNESQIQSFGFDFELTFLQSFVQNQISIGKKEYDKKRRMGGDLNGIEIPQMSSDLKFAPYSAPSKGFSKINADLQQSNPLFVQQQVAPNTDEGLIIQGKKRWGQAPEPGAPEQKIDSHYNTTNNINNAIQDGQTPSTSGGQQNQYSNPASQKRPVEKQENKKDKEREKLQNALFGGIGTSKDNENEDGSDSDDDSKKKKKKKKDKKKKKEREEKKEEESQPNIADLLDIGQNSSQNQQQPLDLLTGDIPTQITSNFKTTANLLDDLFIGDAPPQQAVKIIQPLILTTEQFGQMWVGTPNEKKAAFQAPQILNPIIYSTAIKNKLDFYPIEIINNEVIAAGKVLANGSICLVHCRINNGGQLEFTVRASHQETVDLLTGQLLFQAMINPY